MRQLFLLLVLVSAARSQANFGTKKNVNTRLGLLADELGLSATGESSGRQTSSAFTNQPNAPFVQGGGEFDGGFSNGNQLCCCIPLSQQCVDPSAEPDYVGAGLIDARIKPKEKLINTRIVNRPQANTNSNTNSQQKRCPSNQHQCCYGNNIDLSVFGRACNPPTIPTAPLVDWKQSCDGFVTRSSAKTCGTRSYNRPLSNLQHAEASPGEFPWTCLLLNQNNDFIGTCALIPANTNNNNREGVKVITAAHKLKALEKNDLLKIRVGEYDATGFNAATEKFQHAEYTVVRILKHPEFNTGRLSNDIALLYVDSNNPIKLDNDYVNTACLPSCKNQFSHTFNNGTGVRCWVAGWGKDEFDGSFQPIPHKVDLPLVPAGRCTNDLKQALNKQRRGSGNRFTLSNSEVCAGGQVGKDACTGDGGSPLVCQSDEGYWTVVGLVTWGVGCASEVPGVYADVAQFTNWINSN